jgi:preprotein translocase subunit YajC
MSLIFLKRSSEDMEGLLFAQNTGGGNGSSASQWYSIIPIVLMIVIFYFLLIRPQQKREKDRKSMISNLKKGDKVITSGGMYGVIESVQENDIVVLKISGNTKVEFSKSSIQLKIS